MKVTVLAENYTVSKGLVAEHGLSLHIECGGKSILFDMGQSDAFLKNAEKLNINISSVDMAFLSHGHYDHGGGIHSFLKENHKAPIYASKNVFGRFYSKNGYIGLDASLQGNGRFVYVDNKIKISDSAVICGGENIRCDELNNSSNLEKEEGGIRLCDDFAHEQYLIIEENGKRILFSGCSHRGILNILEYFKPNVFVGGMHLSSFDYYSSELEYISKKLVESDTVYYTCHCTGIEQYSYIKSRLGRRLNYMNCGKTVIIP